MVDQIEKYIEEVFETYDVNYSGKLNKLQLKKFVISMMKFLKVEDEMSEESYLELYKAFDTNDSGFVSKTELKRFMYQLTGLPINENDARLKSPREPMNKIINDAKKLGVNVHKVAPGPSRNNKNGYSKSFETNSVSTDQDYSKVPNTIQIHCDEYD